MTTNNETKKQQKEKSWKFKDLIISKDGGLSLSKITMLLGFLVVSYVVLKLAHSNSVSSEIFALYIGSTFGANSLNKAIAVFGKKNEQHFDYTSRSKYDEE